MAEDLAEVPEQTVFFSRRTTFPARRRARLKAMLVPITPPPMTTISALSIACLSRQVSLEPAGRGASTASARTGAPPRPTPSRTAGRARQEGLRLPEPAAGELQTGATRSGSPAPAVNSATTGL